MSQRATSTIPIVLDALEDKLKEALKTSGDDGGQLPVYQGEAPTEPREHVEIGDVIGDAEQEWAALGARQKEERYAIGIYISTNHEKYGKTQRSAKDRAFEILAVCENALRASLDLGLVADQSLRYLEMKVATIASGGSPAEKGYLYEITWAVRVVARI